MERFKFLTKALALLIIAGLVSCQKDVKNIDEEDDGSAKAYLSINISVPNDNASTRDAENSGTEELGVADEYAINNVTLYFFTEGTTTPGTDYDYNGTYVQKLTVSGGFATVVTAPNVTHTSNTAQQVSGLSADGSTVYHVYAVVNGATSIPVLNSTITERDFLNNSRVTGLYETNGLVSLTSLNTTGWTMASRNVTAVNSEGKFGAYHTLVIPATNNSSSPATVELSVERIMGKLMLTAHSTDNKYNVTYDPGSGPITYASVELTGTKVINTRKDGYLFRHMTRIDVPTPAAADPFFSAADFNGFDKIGTATYGADKKLTVTETDYVVDPRTKSKTAPSMAAGYDNWYTAATPAFGSPFVAMPTNTTTPTNLGYCLENTMHSTAQLNGYTTGVVFEGKVTPVEIVIYNSGTTSNDAPVAYVSGTHPATFYNYGNMFYGSIEALVELGLPLDAATTDAGFALYTQAEKEAAIKDLEANSVRRLESGVCYYKYWITHEPSPEHMAVMEYGIVRNNVYKMKVTGISGIGESVEYIIDPEEEDEHAKVFLKVELDILPWIVRAQEDIIL